MTFSAASDLSLNPERVTIVFASSDWTSDLELFETLFGAPSAVDETRWAQFEVAAARIALAADDPEGT